MSFDEIFDLTAGVYLNFYNNTTAIIFTSFIICVLGEGYGPVAPVAYQVSLEPGIYRSVS